MTRGGYSKLHSQNPTRVPGAAGALYQQVSGKELMGTTYRFLATVEEASVILDWFRVLPERPVETVRGNGSLFYFHDFGSLESDAKKSPVVNVILPVRKHGILTTIGEVHFLSTPLSAFPGLNKINKRFRVWLAENPCVYSQRADFIHEWDYFLEGSAKNWDPEIFALPNGMAVLRRGSYFVAGSDNESMLDRVCRALELRGVKGVLRLTNTAEADGHC